MQAKDSCRRTCRLADLRLTTDRSDRRRPSDQRSINRVPAVAIMLDAGDRSERGHSARRVRRPSSPLSCPIMSPIVLPHAVRDKSRLRTFTRVEARERGSPSTRRARTHWPWHKDSGAFSSVHWHARAGLRRAFRRTRSRTNRSPSTPATDRRRSLTAGIRRDTPSEAVPCRLESTASDPWHAPEIPAEAARQAGRE